MVFSRRSNDGGGSSYGRAFSRGAVLSQSAASAVLERRKNSEVTTKKSLLAVALGVISPTLMALAAGAVVMVVLDAMAVVL